MKTYAYIHIYIIYYMLRINRYMHILYIEPYIIYELRAREEIDSFRTLRPSRVVEAAEAAGARLIQLVSFPGHVVNDHYFCVTLKRVKNAPQGFGR